LHVDSAVCVCVRWYYVWCLVCESSCSLTDHRTTIDPAHFRNEIGLAVMVQHPSQAAYQPHAGIVVHAQKQKISGLPFLCASTMMSSNLSLFLVFM
jgi:hypothetical protein